MTSNGSSIGRLAVRNTVWLTIFSYASQFVAFVATIFLTRLLGPEVFGLFAIGMFWTGLLALRTKFGLAGACIRQPELNGELLGSYYGLDLAISGLSLVLGIVAACLLPQLGYAPQVSYVVIVMMIVEALPALINPLSLALEKELQLSRLTISALVATIISYGLGIILALAGAGLWSLLVMSLVNAILTMAGTYLVCRWRLPAVFHLHWRFTRMMAKRLLKQGLPGGLASLGIVNVVNQYDNFLIGTLVSTTTLGYYDRAYRLSQWPNVMLTQVLSRIGLVTFARVQDDLPRLTHAMRLALWSMTTLGTPIALVLFFGAAEIIAILYGPAWATSSFFLRFLAVYTLFSPFISLGSSLAYAVGNVRMTMWITATQVVTILSVATLLTLAFGAVGTMVGVGITIMVGFSVSAWYIFRRLPLSARSVFGAPLVAIAIATGLTLFATSRPGWLDLSSLVRLIIIGFTSAGGYLISLFALQPGETLTRIRYIVRTFRGANASS